MKHKTEVIEKFRELQGIIEKESQKENGLYNGLIDGVISEYIEDLESECKERGRNMKKQTHYIIPGREKQPIELMRLGLNDSEFEGYCIGNVLKYILRYKHKGGENDLYKARTYIDFLMRSHNHEPILGDDDDGDVDEVTA